MITRGDNVPDMPTPADVLEPYRKRKIRAMLGRYPNRDNAEPIVALFALVYDGARNVDHAAAVAVADELHATDKTVQDLLDGWRPSALGVARA